MEKSIRTSWKRFALYGLVTACLSAAAEAKDIIYWGYYEPQGTDFKKDLSVPPKYVDNYIRSSEPYAFTVKPEKGWKVGFWRVIEGYEWEFKKPSDAAAVGEGQLTLDAGFLLNQYTSPTLAIQFDYLTYTVKYESTRGTVPAAATYGYTASFALPEMDDVSGYVFAGWAHGSSTYPASTSFQGKDFSELDTVHDDSAVVTFTAVWNQKPTITVEAGEHGSVSKNPNQEFYDVGLPVTLTATPDLGYAFKEWSDGNVESNRTVKVTESKTYRATFTNCVYMLTFETGSESVFAPKLVTYLDYVRELPTPEKFRNVFKGWYTSPSGGEEVTQLTKYTWPMDITLTALWEQAPARMVAVKADPEEGGTVSGGGSDFIAGDKTTLVATPNPGYSFKMWSDRGAQSHQVMVQDDAEYTATFTGNVYSVTFDAGGGIASEPSRDYIYGQPYGSFPTASREGHVFNGWFIQATGGDALKTNNDFKVEYPDAGDIVFHAQWTLRPTFSIAYDGNGADRGTMAVQSVYCDGEGTNLTANAFLKAGNRFLGWATVAGGLVKYANGAFVAADWAAPGETNTLYAVWQEYTLAEAMHCETLEWKNFGGAGYIPWTVFASVDELVGSNTLSCVRQAKAPIGNSPSVLTSSAIESDGTLTFVWKQTGDNDFLWIWISQSEAEGSLPKESRRLSGVDGAWSYFSTNLQVTAGRPLYVHIMNTSSKAACDIDLMTWTPASTEPERGDAVKIESATLANGVFKLGMAGDPNVDYGIWTNADVRTPIEDWGFMTNRVGEGSPFEFELKVVPDVPQLFYRAYKVK